MQQLITIETVPISIEYVEKKPLKVSGAGSAKLEVTRQNHAMSIKSDPIPLKMDRFQPNDTAKIPSLTYTATAQYSKDGMLKLNLHMDGDLTGSFTFSQVGRSIDSMVDSVPKATHFESGDAFTHMPGMNINFDMSKLSGGMLPVSNFDTNFMPPDLELKVLERPKVIIKYVGGPIYIPRSADPDYTPPTDVFAVGDGKPNLDTKA